MNTVISILLIAGLVCIINGLFRATKRLVAALVSGASSLVVLLIIVCLLL